MEEQRTGNREAKDRNSGIEPQKGDTGTVDRQGNRLQETGSRAVRQGIRGREIKNTDVRKGTEDGRQETEP